MTKSLRPGPRRLARELALRLLFQRQLSGGSPEAAIRDFERCFSPEKDEENGLEVAPADFQGAWPLAQEFFLGVCAHLEGLDEAISQASEHWSLRRMSPVDLALIRLAYFEMLYREDIPPLVSLNEAVDLGRSYGSHDSGAFINGVLDKLMPRDSPAAKEAAKDVV
ncbi:MAG: transcription antitermination factor NusB [Candidatus Adiutrix sp.]|jgi:N utilization substance protein B|nr:transcription antitermination factor NusB [Candidatus Adiutrix sp.]